MELGRTWVSFLLAIGFGSAYQWLSIRAMWNDLHRNKFHEMLYGELVESGFRHTKWMLQLDKHNRSIWYGLMLVFFHLGAIFFVVYAYLAFIGDQLPKASPLCQACFE